MSRPTYEAFMRSKEKNVVNPPVPREFGGTLPGGLSYTFDTIPISATSDEDTIKIARREARKREMILLRVTSTLYERIKFS